VITLFIGTPNLSSWSTRAYLILEASGLPFEERVVELDRPDSAAKLAEVSPTGRVPVLRDGDLLVWDSLAIAEYLAEKVPSLWPEDVAARATARSLCAEMHSSFVALRTHMPQNLMKRAPGEGRTPEVLADIARICELWRSTRKRFGAGGDFLFSRFTIADAFFTPVAGRFLTYGVEVDEVCTAYLRALIARPAMQKWLERSA
jgi:glutathione S-transferase